ncbi:hypothetical protein HHL11_10115 [Ramlibacter sp. G-1-2-2]|uniref:L,D-TPase catalytic domain-containing protein n=1 Tax=Ramlibacter agri TaxID=2728837 RepID=A0A848H0K5_9BURK|nr:hypothetical protein [Ramlibacter agri]NML44104.1 hypothetical protein [Ramlibacter agri]
MHTSPRLLTAFLGAALLAAPAFAAAPDQAQQHHHPKAHAKAHAAARPAAHAKASSKASAKPALAKKEDLKKPGPLADFGKETGAPEDVVHVANWVSYTRNAGRKSFVIIDKKQAQMYVFDPQGKLKSRSTVLLGKAVGDQVAQVGNTPISKLKESDKTTPAGRFPTVLGKDNHHADIIWIDYKNSLSIHRMASVSASERRAERMGSDDPKEHRISNGCVNVPAGFYNSVLHPTVRKYGAVVYVLPETKTPQQAFGSFEVPAPSKPKEATPA